MADANAAAAATAELDRPSARRVSLLRDLHVGWAWVVDHRQRPRRRCGRSARTGSPALRTRALWWFTVAAEVSIFVQVALGVAVLNAEDIEPPQFHMFYGFVGIIAVGIIYSYRTTSPWVRERIYLLYGVGGLFLMGLGIRAMLVGDRGRVSRATEVHDGAGERAGDAVDHLHPAHDHLAELVDRRGLGAGDHVVGAGDVLGRHDAVDLGDLVGHLGGLADLGLDEDVRADGHGVPPGDRVRRAS